MVHSTASARVIRAASAALLLIAAVCCAGAQAGEKTQEGGAARYTFSWPLQGDALQPRGGTTRGPAVTLDREPSEPWRKLQARGLTDFERDRRAILAMAGHYRVTFDFLEIALFGGSGRPHAPYQSWGTEKIYVDRDEGAAISLVHILEMRVVQPDGSLSEPIVTRHWRQDWRHQPAGIVEYRGRDRWVRRSLDTASVKGAWSQTVHQVDESPRYASTGRWEHTAAFSTWLSSETWRPLPRREWSVRDDYQALIGTNRHTITPWGWLQEENNLKAVLTQDRRIDAARPYLAREYGVARYERIRGQDFSAADRYYRRTSRFWNQVRERWDALFAAQSQATLRGPVDKLGLFVPLFQHADAIAEGGADADARNAEVIERALREMGAIH